MRQIEAGSTAARALEPMFPPELPARQRLLGVLDGTLTGAIFAADDDPPSWATVTELADGTTYVGGSPSPDDLAAVFGAVRPVSEEIVVGLAGPADPVRSSLPDAGIRWSRAVDCTDRVDDGGVLDAPPGTELVVMTPELLATTEWYADTVMAFRSIERWLELGLGRALLVDGQVACEATSAPVIRGAMEMGVLTKPAHRGKGYATLTCRQLARDIEARGHRPWWNTNARNAASLAVARGIGFRSEREYELAWWEISTFQPSGAAGPT